LAWGFTGILGKVIELDALTIVWYRLLIAFVALGFYLYFSKKNRLVLIYDTGIREELTLKKIKALPPFLSYDDEETANEEYMILTKENEEWKFVKRWEE
jgi:hypothetical protein